ncbi:LacI-family transcriptional regulator [Sphingobium herbicidovorans NBRC 16415]|uniref:LacI-family transcriptional regulator n=1 Tax=Sphingobium herbicidovorans (strain ATCC 700291 / DSM 11019 / CCUG 56400 / KCTC 2939 / LMG 18315 / NBRC 16415 / MH) TaxID=1219045 RepID=A0A086PE56_SPHHM|nr:LacI family DNA-binding transcriptional regulator [Sphingobium herbicidovorans]KFG91674.1 LacI-family transcriptional regulator [Sphingobium herbicidovorans NBRC 16415]
MSSIHDVAAQAGVSIKTVSRVVNKASNVSDALRDRVMAAIAQLDYRPNQSARRLAGGRSFMIAFLYNNPVASYISGIQAGAVTRCRALGYHLVVELIPLDGTARFDILEGLVAALRPDGVFLAPPLSDDPAVLQWLADRNLPCARIAGSVTTQSLNIPTPELDAGRMVADHLIALGHRRIGIITPPPFHRAAACRVDGFREGLTAAGVASDEALFVEGAFDYASGMAAGERLLNLDEPPTAIFATNDDMALGVLALARQRGLTVPGQLSVVGFDDTPASLTAWPPLTTVRQPLAEMGAAVIDALINGPAEAPAFRFELVPRDSSAPPGG